MLHLAHAGLVCPTQVLLHHSHESAAQTRRLRGSCRVRPHHTGLLWRGSLTPFSKDSLALLLLHPLQPTLVVQDVWVCDSLPSNVSESLTTMGVYKLGLVVLMVGRMLFNLCCLVHHGAISQISTSRILEDRLPLFRDYSWRANAFSLYLCHWTVTINYWLLGFLPFI